MKIRELGSFEETQIICNDFSFNGVIVLSLENCPSFDSIKNAYKTLQKRQALLRVIVAKERNKYFYKHNDNLSLNIKNHTRRDDLHWREIVEIELNTKFDISKDLFRMVCILPNRDGNVGEIILTIQHAIMDASSANSLVDDFLLLLENQNHFDSSEPFEMKLQAEKYFPPSHQGFSKYYNSSKFFFKQFLDEITYKFKSIGKPKPSINLNSKNRILTRKLSKETAEKLFKLTRKKGLTIFHIFNAAILMVVHNRMYNKKQPLMRIFNFTDLRPYIKPPLKRDYLGCYFAMMRFTINMVAYKDIWHLSQRINRTISASYKRGDKFSSLLLGKGMMKAILKFKSSRMGHAAVSYTGPVRLKENYGEVEVKKLHSFISNFGLGPEYTAQVRLFNGEIYWDFVYLDTDMDNVEASKIADDIFTLLESSIRVD